MLAEPTYLAKQMPKLPLEDPGRFINAIAGLASRAKADDLIGLLDIAESDFAYVTDDWGITYFRLELVLPWDSYAGIGDVESVESRLAHLTKKASRACAEERVHEVRVSANFDAPSDWRTGAKPVVVSASDSDRIWKPGWFRLFLSHESGVKREAHELKEALARRFVVAFVAHDDIEPSRSWQKEIELALGSCHAIAALVTDGFHKSVWCMQEVGWGLGRGVLVQPIKLPIDPLGFTNGTQALKEDMHDLTTVREPLVNLFAANSKTTRYMHEPLVLTLEHLAHKKAVPIVIESLERIQGLSEDHARRILAAAGQNKVLRDLPAEVVRLRGIVERFGVPTAQPAVAADEYDPFADE